MSGGSFNYLYNKDVLDLLRNDEGLAEMQFAMKEYEGHEKASEAMAQFLKQLEQMRELLSQTEESWGKLWYVTRAVEWHHSCDSSKSDVEKELKKF